MKKVKKLKNQIKTMKKNKKMKKMNVNKILLMKMNTHIKKKKKKI